MKKLFLLTLAVMLLCGSVMAQDDAKKEKKKGGFMSNVKKGIESNTGLRVSDEALFVYPVMGEWKMTVAECTGDKETGIVILKINTTKLMNGQMMSTVCILIDAVVTDTKTPLTLERRSADPLYHFQINTPVEITCQAIGNVPTDAKTLDVKFYISYRDNAFEARRIPINWE